jgi:uncharacterized repeat protein (TIGR03803 family)
MLAGRATAQTFRTLHNFSGTDGASPQGGMVLGGNTLYGVAAAGGTGSNGVVFAVNTDGTDFTVLHNFTPLSNSTNADGAGPIAIASAGGAGGGNPRFSQRLVLSDNTLYGTAPYGGKWGNGTVFAVNTDGTGFQTLHSFTAVSNYTYLNFVSSTNIDGASPNGGLVLSGNTLYGSAVGGGAWGSGTVFALYTNGLGFTNLHSFTRVSGFPGYFTNSDGALPNDGLVLSGNTLYGTAYFSGTGGWGTVFAVNTDGTGFQTLVAFPNPQYAGLGADPSSGLVLSGNRLYGTTVYGGSTSGVYSAGDGTVFAVNADGTGFAVLHSFNFNIDGDLPCAPLLLSGNTLYGTASEGGEEGNGTVFAIKTDGSGFTILHTFSAPPVLHTELELLNCTNSDGADPYDAGLVMSGNTLYGTAVSGGSSADGTVFSISFSPQLNVRQFESGLVLAWPTNYAGFDFSGFSLQSTTNLVSTVWSTNFPPPVVVNGQNTVTNPISGTQQFFRLSK